jgi:hypothetical protein
LWIIHYSCESFYDRPNGQSPRITSIAVRNVRSGQTRSFSIHQVAEQQGVPFDEIDKRYDALELKMLNAFYSHVSSFQGTKYIHWNMRDINYGFAAIEHRHRVLGGQPVVIEDDRKIDLARLLIDIYGVGYAAHPRLTAQAFENRNFVALHQSTLRKVDILADILERAHDRQLKTNTTWWEMHGGRCRALFEWLAKNKIIAFLLTIAGLLLAIWALHS